MKDKILEWIAKQSPYEQQVEMIIINGPGISKSVVLYRLVSVSKIRYACMCLYTHASTHTKPKFNDMKKSLT